MHLAADRGSTLAVKVLLACMLGFLALFGALAFDLAAGDAQRGMTLLLYRTCL